MGTAMVTTRMTEEKKAAGARIFKEMGTSASRAINELYDYIIENGALPFPEKQEAHSYTRDQLNNAIAFVKDIPAISNSRFATMTDDEIRRERLISKGLMKPEEL